MSNEEIQHRILIARRIRLISWVGLSSIVVVSVFIAATESLAFLLFILFIPKLIELPLLETKIISQLKELQLLNYENENLDQQIKKLEEQTNE